MLDIVAKNFNLTGASQAWRAFRARIFSKHIYFVHVPKSGGTSLSHILRSKYPVSFGKVSEEASTGACVDISGREWMLFKTRLFRYFIEQDLNYVQAHCPVGKEILESYQGKGDFITIIRNPIERAISSYNFDPRLREMSFDEFLESERGIGECGVLRYYFAGIDTGFGDVGDDVRTAIENLNNFSVVGLLEYPENFSDIMYERLRIRIRLPKRNIGKPAKQLADNLSAVQRNKLEEMCRADMEIYNYFKRKVENA